jgi:hypothetical protein
LRGLRESVFKYEGSVFCGSFTSDFAFEAKQFGKRPTYHFSLQSRRIKSLGVSLLTVDMLIPVRTRSHKVVSPFSSTRSGQTSEKEHQNVPYRYYLVVAKIRKSLYTYRTVCKLPRVTFRCYENQCQGIVLIPFYASLRTKMSCLAEGISTIPWELLQHRDVVPISHSRGSPKELAGRAAEQWRSMRVRISLQPVSALSATCEPTATTRRAKRTACSCKSLSGVLP